MKFKATVNIPRRGTCVYVSGPRGVDGVASKACSDPQRFQGPCTDWTQTSPVQILACHDAERQWEIDSLYESGLCCCWNARNFVKYALQNLERRVLRETLTFQRNSLGHITDAIVIAIMWGNCYTDHLEKHSWWHGDNIKMVIKIKKGMD